MKIDNLIRLLNNRLREFQLSRDYARMSGDLERMNVADKEIIDLEDTLYQLNLLVDTSKSAAVREATLAEVITDGSVAILGEYDITIYATDPLHEEKIMNILSKMGVMDTVEKIDDYINRKYFSSPVTGEMIISAASAYDVDARLMMAIIEQDSSFGTAGKAVRTLNPGNVGNDDSGNLRAYESWQEGVTAVAEWLNRHRGSTIISEIPEETVLEPVATSTPPIITPTTTTTTSTVTSTPETIPVITSTTTTATTTPATATSTEEISPVITSTTTTTPAVSTSTPETIPVITSTTTISTEEISPVVTSTTTTSTEETIPVITSTTTTATTTSTE
ncbi:hypothetical protein A3I37_03020 [Candidatus Uhrbacteria bacterium RIFCSPLOWO2_02_FULL_46_19]|nr:MAG: hypothetical protein A3I37_03020 [Candidatus Uhrbacteria bacterium RIFCSPLOWO2_02_FULL_46_19]